MDALDWISLAVVGRLIMFTLRKVYPTASIKYETLRNLVACDFCFGVWIYVIMSLLFRADIYSEFNTPIITNMMTGITTSFLVWIFVDGWKSRFEVIKI